MRRARTASQRLGSDLALDDALPPRADAVSEPASARSLGTSVDSDLEAAPASSSRILHQTSSREQEFDVRKLDSAASTPSPYGRRRTTRYAPWKNGDRCSCDLATWRSDAVRLYRRVRTKVLFEVQRLGLLGWICIFLLPCLVDVTWVLIYFAERQQDVQRENGPCTDPNQQPSPSWETPRVDALLYTQMVFSLATLIVWLPFRIFYAGSYKFRHILYPAVFADLITCLPFVVAIFLPSARTVYVPAFLRIWMFRFELGFFYNQTSLWGESVLFIASGVAVGITMVACFEWAQNNFAVSEAVFADSAGAPSYPCTDFAVSIYFIIVTLSTVGYGDVTPSNQYSRAVAAISISVFIVLLPYSVGRIRDLLHRSRDRKHVRYVARTHNAHVVVHGHLDDALLGHVLYYFNPVRRARRVIRGQAILHDEGEELHSMLLSEKTSVLGGANYVVAMSENAVSADMLARVALGYQRSYISLFEGSLLSARDLSRCEILQAQAVFVLPTLHVYGDNFYRSSGAEGRSQAASMGMRPFGTGVQRQESHESQDLDSCGGDARAQEALGDMHDGMRRVQHAAAARNRLYSRDYRTLLRAWSTHQNIHTDQLLVVVLFHEFNKQFLFDHAAHYGAPLARNERSALMERNLMTISLDAFQQEVLAASCLVPGLSTVITNFFVGEDRGVSVANDGSGEETTAKPGPGVSYDLELGSHMDHLRADRHEDSDDSDDNGDQEDADQDDDDDDGETRTPRLAGVTSGFVFQSRRHLSRKKSGSQRRRREKGPSASACGCADAEPVATLHNYSRGLQNELEVMVIRPENPFLGWSRLELAVTIHRDFSVIVLAVIREEDAHFSKGEDREVEFFRNAHQEISAGDHVVFLGRGNNLDALFHTRKEDYDIRTGEIPSRHRKRRASRLRTTLASHASSQGANNSSSAPGASAAALSLEVASPRGGGGDARPEDFQHHTNASTAADFFDEDNRLEPHAGVPADIDEVSDCDPTPHRSLTDAFIRSWNELAETEDGPDRRHRHVILCCPQQSPIEMFVRSLYSRRQTDGKPPVWIVWLVSAPPSEMIWERVSRLPNLVWMLGESCVAHDLLRAGIREASDIVIFSDIFESYIPNVFTPGEAVEAADVDRYIISSHRVVTSLIETFHLRFLRVHTHINSANNGQYLHESSWRRLILDQAFVHGKRPHNMASGTASRNSIWERLTSSLDMAPRGSERKAAIKMLNQLTSSVWPILLNETYAAGESWSASSIFFILFSSYMGGGCGIIFLLVQKLIKLAGKQGVKPGDYNGFRLVRVPKDFHGKTFESLYAATLERHQALCLGLFRGYGHGMNHPKYGKPTILINPADMLIAPCDFVYVIGGVKAPRRASPHAPPAWAPANGNGSSPAI